MLPITSLLIFSALLTMTNSFPKSNVGRNFTGASGGTGSKVDYKWSVWTLVVVMVGIVLSYVGFCAALCLFMKLEDNDTQLKPSISADNAEASSNKTMNNGNIYG